jgi:hypothetical protein
MNETIFEFLESLRERPALFFGKRSLIRLHAYLLRYQAGVTKANLALGGEEHFAAFHDWVAKALGFSSSTAGWSNMILEKSGSDEAAFKMFFELLDRFKKDHGIT